MDVRIEKAAQPGVRLTERAARHVQGWLSRNGGNGLRLAVKPTGCSGYQYIVEAASEAGTDDAAFDSHGVRVLIDAQSLPFLAGTELDYVRDGLKEGFRFHNPNVRETCGCGESFSIGAQSGTR